MNGFSRVFLEMSTCDPYLHGGTRIQNNLKFTLSHDRIFELAYLIAFRKVGIEVIFAVETTDVGDLGVDCQAKQDGHMHGGFV